MFMMMYPTADFSGFMGSLNLQRLGQGLLLTVVCYWVAWIVYTRTFHGLARYPGPFWASISRIWVVMHVLRGDAHKEQKKLHDKYGAVVRIAPNEVIINDPRSIKKIYGVNSGFTKTDFYLPFRNPFSRYPDHFTSTDEKVHAARRRIVSNVYSMTSILQSEQYLDECTDIFIQQLGVMADCGDSFDLFKWCRMYAYDVIGELYFSKMFGFLEAGHDILGYMKAIDVLIPVMTLSAVMPTYVRSLFMFTGILFSRVRKALAALESLTTAADGVVNERLREDSQPYGIQHERPDVIGKVFDIYYHHGAKVDFQLADVKLEAYGGFFAGSDTTAISISSTLYHIIKNRNVYQTLVDEIDRATAEGRLSSPFITYNEATQLPYLSACIQEGFRMHPSTALSFPRNVPSGGCEVAGCWLPDHARVGVNSVLVQQDKSIFGPDAEDFNPDRWFRSNAENMNRHMMHFGMGSRTCMGKHISSCEIFKIIPQILRLYHLELRSPHGKMQTTAFWFYKPKSIIMNVRRR